MEKGAIPQSVKQTEPPKTVWKDLMQGWYIGVRYDGFILIAHTGGLKPDDPKAVPSICQLTPEAFKAAAGEVYAMSMALGKPKP